MRPGDRDPLGGLGQWQVEQERPWHPAHALDPTRAPEPFEIPAAPPIPKVDGTRVTLSVPSSPHSGQEGAGADPRTIFSNTASQVSHRNS